MNREELLRITCHNDVCIPVVIEITTHCVMRGRTGSYKTRRLKYLSGPLA